MSEARFFSGNSNRELAQEIVDHLALKLGEVDVRRYSDGEVSVEYKENIRGKDVFLIQSTCYPAAENLLELLLMADAARRASAAQITAVVPYFGYARQDRRGRSARVPISARVIADMISSVGIDRVLTVELHVEQIQGFFRIPVDNVYASKVMLEHMQDNGISFPLIISPDIGGVARARAVAKLLDTDLAIIDKRRQCANESEVMHVIGEPKGRDCVLIDDMLDTGGTACQVAKVLKQQGASSVSAYAVHPVLSGNVVERIDASELDHLTVTNTIPLNAAACNSDKIHQVSIGPLIAQALQRMREHKSISELFPDSHQSMNNH